MNRRIPALALLLLLATTVGCGGSAPPTEPVAEGFGGAEPAHPKGFGGAEPADPKGFKGGVFEPARAAPDFELQGTNGSPVTLRDLRGKVVILEFGFTTCQRVCPTTLANLAQVFDELGPAASEVQVVFVTVDPERDTLERLRGFLAGFDESFVGATGTPEQLTAIREAYGVLATKEQGENPGGYQVHHSSSIYLIDREGQLRVMVPFGKPAPDVVHDIRLLLGSEP